MPFGLQNVGATYQLAMAAIFHDMLHECLVDYIDDIIIKSREVNQHVDDLEQVFLTMQAIHLEATPFEVCFRRFFKQVLGIHCKISY